MDHPGLRAGLIPRIEYIPDDQNVVPRHYDPRSDQLSTVELEAQLLKLRGDYATAVDSLPGHEDYLRERGAHYRAMGAS
jgi:hypothetical protein